MPNVPLPNLGLTHGWLPTEDDWGTPMNDTLRELDALVQPAVEDKDLTTPPSHTNGNRYIVAASAGSDWAGQDGNIAQSTGTAWVFYTPKNGWRAYVRDERLFYAYHGGWFPETGIHNVKAYGATGDGSTNDTTAIQNAINAANTAGGGTVWFPPGTYACPSSIAMKDGVSLLGAGKGSVLKDTGSISIISLTGVDDFTVSGLAFTSTVPGPFVAGRGALWADASSAATRGVIQNCFMSTLGTCGIAGFFQDTKIIGNDIRGTKEHGIYLSGSSDCSVIGNTIVSAGSIGSGAQCGVKIATCDSITVSGNVIRSPEHEGVLLEDTNQSSVSANIISDAPQRAIRMISAIGCVASSNVCIDSTLQAIRLFPSCVDCVVTDNVLDGGGDGVAWADATRCVVSDNNIRDMTGSNLLAVSGTNSVTLRNNVMDDGTVSLDGTEHVEHFNVRDFGATGDGSTNDTTAIQTAIDAAEVAGGTVFFPPGTYKVSTTGLVVGGSNVWLRGTGPASIITAAASGTSIIVTVNNAAEDCGIESLQVQGQATGDSTTQIGVQLSGSALRTTIRDVVFSGTSGSTGLNYGIDTEAGSDDNLIIGNTFRRIIGSATGGAAMLIESSDYNRIIGNRVFLTGTQGRHGVYLSVDSSYNVVSENIIVSGRAPQIQVNSTDPQAGCYHNEISHNICDSMSTNAGATNGAIHILNKCQRNRVHGNQILNSGRNGITIESSGSVAADASDNNTVEDNYIYNPQQVGIQVYGADNTEIFGNRVVGANQVAASFDAVNLQRASGTVGIDGTRIIGNVILGSSHVWGVGIDSAAPVSANTILRANHIVAGSGGILKSTSATGVRFEPTTGRGTDIASAATIAVPSDGDVFHVTGTTNITNGVTVSPHDNGRLVTLIFDGALTISDTGTSKLAGNYTTVGADDTLTLRCDGTNWHEVARSGDV